MRQAPATQRPRRPHLSGKVDGEATVVGGYMEEGSVRPRVEHLGPSAGVG